MANAIIIIYFTRQQTLYRVNSSMIHTVTKTNVRKLPSVIAIVVVLVISCFVGILTPPITQALITSSSPSSSSSSSSRQSSPSSKFPSQSLLKANDCDHDQDKKIYRYGVSSIKNFRPIIPGSNLYRSATLDDLTEEDTERLLNGSAFFDDGDDDDDNQSSASSSSLKKGLAAVIDLRNNDEIEKGKSKRTKGSINLYDSLDSDDHDINFISIPILNNVNEFWEETINTMDSNERIIATLKTTFVGGALDRAAARHLEKGGLSLLYKIMIKTNASSIQLAKALDVCLKISEESNGTRPIIFHCQKGKDRTGILAMLLQICLAGEENEKYNDAEIVDAYALSGELLDEMPNNIEQQQQTQTTSSSSSTIDWSYFRGSPSSAMHDTLSSIRQQYGSITGYLDSIYFDEEKRSRLRKYCSSSRKIT
jgi:protein tyrosine/serine phosphatase